MDPMAELAYDFTPYRYGFNNPVFWGDASGLFETEMQAHIFASSLGIDKNNYKIEENSELGGFNLVVNGGFWAGDTFYDYAMLLPEMIISNSAGGSGSSASNKLMNQLNTAYTNTGFRHFVEWDWSKLNSPFKFALMGDDPSNLKAPNGGRNVQWLNVKFIMELADIFSPNVPKRLENASNLVKYIDPNKNKEGKKIGEVNNKTSKINNPQELVNFSKKIFIPEERFFVKTGAAVTRIRYDTMIEPTMINHHNNLNTLDSLNNTK